MTCPLCDQAALARAGRHDRFIAELSETFMLLSDRQGCRGWTVLVLKEHAEHLADLPAQRQARVFADVVRSAAAIRSVFATSGTGGGPSRINYECLGNQVAHVHWHLIPRHRDDPDPSNAIWGWSEDRLSGTITGDEQRELIEAIAVALADVA